MAHLTLLNCRWWVDQFDLSGDANQHTVTFAQEAVDKTTFGSSGVREYLPGLRTASHSHQGFQEAPDAADSPYDALAQNSDLIVTVVPTTDAEAGASVSYQSVNTSFDLVSGTVGGMAMLNLTGQPTGPPVPGYILAPKAARNSSSNTTGFQLGAVSAGKTAYGALHVFAGTASTCAVKIQSDDNSGFSSPTDRITFTTASGATAQWSSVAGAITDSWWRAVWTIGGGTWTFAVTLGIS